jgi:hypothetical protein
VLLGVVTGSIGILFPLLSVALWKSGEDMPNRGDLLEGLAFLGFISLYGIFLSGLASAVAYPFRRSASEWRRRAGLILVGTTVGFVISLPLVILVSHPPFFFVVLSAGAGAIWGVLAYRGIFFPVISAGDRRA